MTIRSHERPPTEQSEARYLPVSVHVVVERQLLVLFDRPIGEDTHPNVLPDCPFCNIAVGIATMVGEAAFTPALCCIDELDAVVDISAETAPRGLRARTSSFCNIMK